MVKQVTNYYWLSCLIAVLLGILNLNYFHSYTFYDAVIIAVIEISLAFIFAFGMKFFLNIKTHLTTNLGADKIIYYFGFIMLVTTVHILLVHQIYEAFNLVTMSSIEEFFKDRFLLVLAAISCLITIIVALELIVMLKENVNDRDEMQNLVQKAELKTLKTQLNPHFLFNSLNAINSESYTDIEMARTMLVNLSDFLRFSLDQADHRMISLQTELENIDRYLQIERLRFGDRLKYEVKVDANCMDLKLPNLILQPIFENVIKHGVNKNLAATRLKLAAWTFDDMLYLTIHNTLPAEDHFVRVGTGTGLNNIKHRMSILFQKEDMIQVIKRNDSFEVKLKIPQHLVEETIR